MFINLFFEWSSAFFIGLVSSIVATIPGTLLFLKWKKRKENKQLREILNFGNGDDIVFVFSHREFKKFSNSTLDISILPRTSTEDFMAINNIKTALLKIGWENKDKIRDTNTFLSRVDEKKKNVISVCSAKTNKYTKEVEDELLKMRNEFFRAVYIHDKKEWQITDGKFFYPTSTYEQFKEQIKKGVPIDEIPTKKFEDVAYITKISNPQNIKNKILLIAGVRGIGTWGAAECLKKEYHQIYEELPNRKKDCDFSALVIIKYDNLDITEIKVNKVIPFIQ